MNATVEQIRESLRAFDRDLRNQPEWTNWVENQNYKYAIFHNYKLYPVKQIVSMATGLPKTDFSGGGQANEFLSGVGFKVLSLRVASLSIESGQSASKILDKSCFIQGTVIPIEIRQFFLDRAVEAGEHRPLALVLNGKEYSTYIAIENSPTKRTRLFWIREFINELAQHFPLHFQCVQDGKELDELPPAEMRFSRESGFERYLISLGERESKSKEWTDEELEETVKSYLWMLEQEIAGKPYSKSGVNKNLREGELNNRTKASVEYRMQNISAVLEDYCLPRISGYLPAKNVGANTKERIGKILESLGAYNSDDYKPSANEDIIDKRVAKILKKGIKGIPLGQDTPARSIITTTAFARDPSVKAWVLNNANGLCEGCGCLAPFLKNDGEPFLEVHHVKTLSDGGSDIIENAVALCPNCHRRCHISEDRGIYTATLYMKLSRLKQVQ